MNEIIVKTLSAPAINKKEILRYAKAPVPTAEISALLEDILPQCNAAVKYKVCYTVLPVTIKGDVAIFPQFSVQSSGLSENLKGAKSVLIFAATLGVDIDRLINRYSSISPTKALLCDAFAGERIEALCDAFVSSIPAAATRFSPGYGDLPLAVQRDVFTLLGCEKNIGLTLNESLTMSPSKSVTAFVGIQG